MYVCVVYQKGRMNKIFFFFAPTQEEELREEETREQKEKKNSTRTELDRLNVTISRESK